MPQASACECGYQPRRADCHEVVVNEGDPEPIYVLHVICYSCGKEWVE